MLTTLTNWLNRRKGTAKSAVFDRGFDYAAGALLRGEESPASLEAKPWPDDVTDFDRGMLAAIDRLVTAGVVHDDRP